MKKYQMAGKKMTNCEGKGNLGMFTDRIPKICAAGVHSAQPNDHVVDSLQHYLVKDEVDALLSDAIMPSGKPKPLPPLRRPIEPDMRNAGPYGELASLLNPPMKTRFQTLVEDFKNTSYKSYWNQALGQVKDPVPMLPEGMDIKSTTFGKKTQYVEPLYDIILPKEPLPDKTPLSKGPGVQTRRNYSSSFNPNLTFGYRSKADARGILAKCCLTDDKIPIGTGSIAVLNVTQAKYIDENYPKMGKVINSNNINPLCGGEPSKDILENEGVFNCLTFCPLNQNKVLLKKCLGHLNTLRKCLRKKMPSFFHDFYLNLKYLDTDSSNWLPKDTVYKMCKSKFVLFDSSLIEPLLTMWKIFDGNKIEYKLFLQTINYREPLMDIPKVQDISDECFHFSTTYREMVKPDQPIDCRDKAGVPSGRYIDMDYPVTPNEYCKANITDLPHESDMKSCLSPSIFSLFNVSHRDMFAKREPHVIRKVFERAGEKFEDNEFEEIWAEAQKYHSEGWVCYETFREAFQNLQNRDKK